MYRGPIGIHQHSVGRCHRNKSPLNFGKISRGCSPGVQKIFRTPIYRSHCAVVFATAQLSCHLWQYCPLLLAVMCHCTRDLHGKFSAGMPQKTTGNTKVVGIKFATIPRNGNLILENPVVAVGRIASRPTGDILAP